MSSVLECLNYKTPIYIKKIIILESFDGDFEKASRRYPWLNEPWVSHQDGLFFGSFSTEFLNINNLETFANLANALFPSVTSTASRLSADQLDAFSSELWGKSLACFLERIKSRSVVMSK